MEQRLDGQPVMDEQQIIEMLSTMIGYARRLYEEQFLLTNNVIAALQEFATDQSVTWLVQVGLLLERTNPDGVDS